MLENAGRNTTEMGGYCRGLGPASSRNRLSDASGWERRNQGFGVRSERFLRSSMPNIGRYFGMYGLKEHTESAPRKLKRSGRP
jgi:hypothetical protein